MARLRKSISDSMLFGVCGGIAEYFGWNSTLVRVVFLIAAFVGIGSPILVYLILALVLPKY
ncbi:MAG: PspC domain-containing protein [Balneolales bacterium]